MFLTLCMDYINDSNIFTSTMFIAFYYLFYNNVMYQQTWSMTLMEDSFTKNLFEEDLHFVRKKVLITLWYLGTQSTVFKVADKVKIDISNFSIIRARWNVVDALVSVIPWVFKWPNRSNIEIFILDFQRTRFFWCDKGSRRYSFISKLNLTQTPSRTKY